MKLAQTLELMDALANNALSLWSVPYGASARLINVSENATYLVEAENYKSILRIHRENYHTKRAIECELAWMKALRQEAGIETPYAISGRDGDFIQKGSVDGLPNERFMVLFDFIEGEQPDETRDLSAQFEKLGALAARTHIHSIEWAKPVPFERLIWDEETIFGKRPTWGDWRDAPGVTPQVKSKLELAEELVRRRLDQFGKSDERFGLIHADMRLANLIVHEGEPRIIDFDDCGLGWFLFDFAAAISFIEDDPAIPALKAAWTAGYRSVRPLSVEEEREIDTFVMLRRMSLLAWIGSHIEAPEPQAMAPNFAAGTERLACDYLKNMAV